MHWGGTGGSLLRIQGGTIVLCWISQHKATQLLLQCTCWLLPY